MTNVYITSATGVGKVGVTMETFPGNNYHLTATTEVTQNISISIYTYLVSKLEGVGQIKYNSETVINDLVQMTSGVLPQHYST